MRVLIAIMSCWKHGPYHQQARETWLQDCPVDYKFFLGGAQIERLLEDEVLLDAPDSYEQNFEKAQQMIRWSFEQGYDYMFKCDADTYVCVSRLLKSGFEQSDFSGRGPYGGSGYWLSRKSLGLLVPCDDHSPLLGEEHWIAERLHNLGIEFVQDPRYWSLTKEGPSLENDIITTHWYSEHGAVRITPQYPEGIVYERRIGTQERMGLICGYHEKAKGIR